MGSFFVVLLGVEHLGEFEDCGGWSLLLLLLSLGIGSSLLLLVLSFREEDFTSAKSLNVRVQSLVEFHVVEWILLVSMDVGLTSLLLTEGALDFIRGHDTSNVGGGDDWLW